MVPYAYLQQWRIDKVETRKKERVEEISIKNLFLSMAFFTPISQMNLNDLLYSSTCHRKIIIIKTQPPTFYICVNLGSRQMEAPLRCKWTLITVSSHFKTILSTATTITTENMIQYLTTH